MSAGSRLVMLAFYDMSLKTKYSRDDESAAMIDYIKDGCVIMSINYNKRKSKGGK
jgi:hypothetical protein